MKMILLPHAQTKKFTDTVFFPPKKCCKTSVRLHSVSQADECLPRKIGWMILFSSALLSLILLCERCECKYALNPPTFPSLVSVLRCVSIFFVEFQQHFEQDYSTTAWIHSMVDCTTMLFGKNRSQHFGPDHRSRESTWAGIVKFLRVSMWIFLFLFFFYEAILHVLMILTLERPGWNMTHLPTHNQ